MSHPHLCVLLLLQVHYKKGHHERKAKYTSLADPPEVELARKADQQRSDVSSTQGALMEIIRVPHYKADLKSRSVRQRLSRLV